MKKALAFFTLLLGCVAMFAQSGPTFPYQAVVRNSQNQLIKDSTFAIGVEVYQGADLKYSETQSVTTNANGQFTMNIGGGTVVSGAMGDIADWSVAKFKITCRLSGGDIVSENAVSPVPYALQAANATSAATGNFLTSDSAVITTMQSEIAALQAASLDCNDVKNCIADTLNAYTPTTQLCNAVKDCDFSGNTSIANLLQTLSDQIAAQNRVVDSLAHIVDSLSNITPVTPVTPTGSFTCGTDKVSDVDGNEYNTVKIGNQCWMKENLKTTKYANNTNIDNSKMFNPNGEADNVTTYGLLYTWSAATRDSSTTYPADGQVKVQGICPTGWHVPSDAEWDTLTHYVFNSTSPDYKCGSSCGSWSAQSDVNCIAKALSSTTGWSSNTSSGCNAGNTGDKANLTGFSALPAGYYYSSYPLSFGGYAYFWSATQDVSDTPWCRYLSSDNSVVSSYSYNKDNGFSVRCVRDAGIGGTPGSNETGGGTNPSTPGEVSCEQVMECMADTLSRLNARITSQGETIAAQGETIDNLNNTVTTQGQTIDSLNNVVGSLSHVVDSLSNLPHGGGDTPTAFNCGTDKVKDVQNNEYNTVQIGNQCWMKENLRTNVGTGDYGYPTGVSGTADTVTYGRLYSWAAVMNGASASSDVPSGVRGICPEGWHVPSDGEWGNLINYVKSKPNEYKCGDDANNIANALSSETGWTNGSTPGCNAGDDSETRNKTGFSAVPAGYFGTNSTNKGTHTYFWSATDSGSAVYYRHLDNTSSSMNSGFEFSEEMGLSVRCLRN